MTGPLWGAAIYEFRMQARRPAVWLVVLLASVLVCAMTREPFSDAGLGLPAPVVVGRWAYALQSLVPASVGVLLADRLTRDDRLRVFDLLSSLPAPMERRLLGKCLGTTAATVLPLACVYALGVIWLTARMGPALLPAAPAAFALVNLPGLLFVAAFSVGCPAVMPVPVYQFLFVGYWFWGNWLSPSFHIPTLSHTILTPRGKFAAEAFFGIDGHAIFGLTRTVPTWQGTASVALLLVGAAAALMATRRLLQSQRAHA